MLVEAVTTSMDLVTSGLLLPTLRLRSRDTYTSSRITSTHKAAATTPMALMAIEATILVVVVLWDDERRSEV